MKQEPLIEQIAVHNRNGKVLQLFNAKDYDTIQQLEQAVKHYVDTHKQAFNIVYVYSDDKICSDEANNIY